MNNAFKYIAVWMGLTLFTQLLAAQGPATKQSGKQAPNFIIILADDLGYGDLGSYGHPTIRTPHLDQLAKEGVRFTQFYVAANVCSPSRAALLTGRLPVRIGITGGLGVFFPHSASGLPNTEVTIAKALKDKGYATGIIGKWHLGHLPQYLPVNYGFDYYFGIPYSNDMIPDNERHIPYPPLPLYKDGKVVEKDPDQHLLTKRYTEEAVNFIKSSTNKPFLLYYPNHVPHVPLYAGSEFNGKSKRGVYGDVVEELDWSVGRIIQTLKEQKLDRNTVVLFLSDNGPWLTQKENGGSAGLLKDGKGSTYEGGVRVPAIAWWPGVIRPAVSTAIVSSLDILPTFLHWAGATIPADRILDGVDEGAVFTGNSAAIRETLFYYDADKLYAVRKGVWKAHFTTHSGYAPVAPQQHTTPLLFDIEHDPGEKYDVSNQHLDVVTELKKLYEDHLATTEKAPPLLGKFLPGQLDSLFQSFIKQREKQAAQNSTSQ